MQVVRICCKGRGTAQEQVFWTGLPGSRHEWDPAPVFRSDSNGHRKKDKTPTLAFLRALGVILVPQKYVGVLQPFPANVDLFSSPCSLTSSAWHPFLLPAFLPQQECAGVSARGPGQGSTTHPVPSSGCARQLETSRFPASSRPTRHLHQQG